MKSVIAAVVSLFLPFLDRFGSLVNHARIQRLRSRARIHPTVAFAGNDVHVSVPEKLAIGEGTALHQRTILHTEGGLTIGHHVHVGLGLTVFTSNHTYRSEKSIPYDETDIYEPVVIEDCVWLGANVSILPGVTIGEGAVVGMGAVVAKDVPRCAIVAGNPAQVLGYRDIGTFERLKAQRKFY